MKPHLKKQLNKQHLTTILQIDDENDENESKRHQESQNIEIGFDRSMTLRESFHNTSELFIGRSSESRDQIRTPSIIENGN